MKSKSVSNDETTTVPDCAYLPVRLKHSPFGKLTELVQKVNQNECGKKSPS